MTELIQISHSRVENFLACERRDYYGYHLGLKRKKEGIALGLGNATHTCTQALYERILEAGYSAREQRKAWDQAVAAMWAKYQSLVAQGWTDDDPKRWTLKEVLEHYVANESIVLKGLRVLAVEKEFHVRWSDTSTILFRVDLIVAEPSGRQLVVDTKAVWDFYSDAELRLLPQLAKYAGMLRFLGHRIEGAAYNMIRTRRVMGGKKLLKAEIVEALYNYFGEDEHPDAMAAWAIDLPKMKVDELQKLCDIHGIQTQAPPEGHQLYRWADVPLSDARVTRALKEQFETAGRIIDRMGLTAEQYDEQAVRSVSRVGCKSCSYRELCPAELNGEDTRLVMDTFTHRDPRELPDLDGEEDDDE